MDHKAARPPKNTEINFALSEGFTESAADGWQSTRTITVDGDTLLRLDRQPFGRLHIRRDADVSKRPPGDICAC